MGKARVGTPLGVTILASWSPGDAGSRLRVCSEPARALGREECCRAAGHHSPPPRHLPQGRLLQTGGLRAPELGQSWDSPGGPPERLTQTAEGPRGHAARTTGGRRPGKGQRQMGQGESAVACPGYFSAPGGRRRGAGAGQGLGEKKQRCGLGAGLAPGVTPRAQLLALQVVSGPAVALPPVSLPWPTGVAGCPSASPRCSSSHNGPQPGGVAGLQQALAKAWGRVLGALSSGFLLSGEPQASPWGRSLSLAGASSVKRGPRLLSLGSHQLQAPGCPRDLGVVLPAQPGNISNHDHSETRPGPLSSLTQNCPAPGGHRGPSPGPGRERLPGQRLVGNGGGVGRQVHP